MQMVALWACDCTLPHTFVGQVFCLWDVPTKNVWCLWDGGTRPHHAHRKFLPVFMKFHRCKGRPMLVLARFGLALSLGLTRGISSAHSSYWLVLSAIKLNYSNNLSSEHVCNNDNVNMRCWNGHVTCKNCNWLIIYRNGENKDFQCTPGLANMCKLNTWPVALTP